MSFQSPAQAAAVAGGPVESHNATEVSEAIETVEVIDSNETSEETVRVEEDNTQGPGAGDRVSTDDLKTMKTLVDYLSEYRDDNGHEVAGVFQRMLNKRFIPEYFQIIKEPIAFSTVRGKLLKKLYKSWTEFVRDFALISHNAQVYNRPSSQVFADAVALRELFKLEMRKLVEKNVLSAEDAELPDLGEIPPVEDSPPPGPDDDEVEEDDDEEDEDEEDDDSDDDNKRRRRRGARSSAAIIKREGGKIEEGSKDDPDAHKKRGRPPKVHTPMEARINTLLKGLRKFKNPGGELKILHFERLPDKTVMPEYYLEIKAPMAMDAIKRKAKRKKYMSVDQALKDLELMFENAKEYNLEDSLVYQDAVDLQREARILAEQEKKKPDSDFVDEDGRLPLPEILHNGEIWKVGDWVHLQNANDLTKPIVAQIYRTWQDGEGQKWINACWYYRPEQTVHRYEKHFFENEVVKTGRYRDHHIDSVVDRCFVMFFTRYNKGRPRGFPADKEVYVCEARYNEDKSKLNKIKTWASCIPDEVRDKDYEMDLFDTPRKMKKVPSPIKHLLREDAKEDDPLPKPTWGADNAPPIVGAVHRRPREVNESPPPEPTPSPPPQPIPEPVRQPRTRERSYSSHNDTIMGNSGFTVPSPVSTNQPRNSYGQQFGPSRPSASPAPTLHQQSSFTSQQSAHHTPAPQTPHFAPTAPAHQYPYTSYTAPALPPLAHQSSNSLSGQEAHYRTPTTSVRSHIPAGSSSNAYNPPRPIEVYTLSDSANTAIPADIRAQFHRDEHDRIMFFTAPPIDAPVVPEKFKRLGHSLKYLAAKARSANKEKSQPKEESGTDQRLKRKYDDNIERSNDIKKLQCKVLEMLGSQIETGTEVLYRNLYGAEWEEFKAADEQRLREVQIEEQKKKAMSEKLAQDVARRGDIAFEPRLF